MLSIFYGDEAMNDHGKTLINENGLSLRSRESVRKDSIRFLLTAVIFFFTIIHTAFADTPVTLYESFAGNINITGTAGTLRTAPDGTNSCSVVTSGSMQLLGVPAGSTIVRAYLYWAGSGGDPAGGAAADYSVTFNGTNVTADRTYTAWYNNAGNVLYFFGGVKDVTALVAGNATYTFSNLTVQNADVTGGGNYCSSAAVLSAFSLVVIYSNPSETLHVINLWEGLQTYRGSSITLAPANFIIPNPVPASSARHLLLTWEGDSGNSGANNGFTENLTFCAPAPCTGTALTDAYNPVNNQFNSTVDIPPNGPFSGTNTTWGVDLDMYDITGYLHAGDASAQAVYSSGADLVILMNQTMSIPNVPTADLVITKSDSGNFLVGSNGFYTLNITNNGPSSTSGTVTVSDTLPTGLTYVNGTGTGWSCSAIGQAVTCTRAAAMTSGESSSIVLTVAVGAGALPGVTNTATVTDAGGTFDNVSGNNTSTDTTSVASPGTGNKPLYLYRDSATTGHVNRTPATVNASSYVNIAEVTTVSFALSPVLQSSVTISSGNIPVRLWLTATSTRTYTIPITLRCGATTIATANGSIALTAVTPPAAPTALDVNLPLAAASTCAPGNNLILDVRNNQSGTGTRDIQVYPAPSTGNYSYVSLNSQNVINVDSVSFYNAAYSGGTQITATAPNQTVYVRATVSDPFGAYDITGATVAMMNPAGAVQLPTPAAMTDTGYSNPASKIYEYAFTLPTGAAALGNWTAQVNAREGTEGTVTDYGTSSLTVALANVTIFKSANRTSTSSGDVITYSILLTNNGNGPATSVSIDDTLGSFIQWGLYSYSGNAFDLVQGGTPSGLTLGTPVYYNGASVYTPVSEGGGAPVNYDGNVTRFVLPLTGTMNPGGASCTVYYQVRVK